MKLSKFLLIGAIVSGFGACNEENVPLVQEKDGVVSLVITQDGATTGLRATDATDLENKESKIHSIDVFVFNGEVVDGYKHENTPTDKVEGIEVTSGLRTIIVVANAPEDLSVITSKSDLLGKIASDLAGQTLANGLLMTSQETAPINIVAGVNYYGYPAGQPGNEINPGNPIELTRAVARVALMGVTVNFKEPYQNWTFENESVFLFNAKKQSKYFGTPLAEGNEYLSGFDLSGFGGSLKPSGWTNTWLASYLKDDVTDLTTISSTAPVYYYTFENTNTAAPASISLRGKLRDGNGDVVTHATHPNFVNIVDQDGYTYFTVIVNASREGYIYTGDTVAHDSKVKRNTQYNITLTINSLGANDPTDPTEKASLNVEVEVTPWVVVNQSVTW